MSEGVALRWQTHQSDMQALFARLQRSGDMSDVTVTNGSCNIRCHRLVLSAACPNFHNLLKSYTAEVVLYLGAVQSSILQALVEFMYHGQVHVPQQQLNDFLQLATQWGIRGLCGGDVSIVPSTVAQDGNRVTSSVAGAVGDSLPDPPPASSSHQPSASARHTQPPPQQPTARRQRIHSGSSDSSGSDTEQRMNPCVVKALVGSSSNAAAVSSDALPLQTQLDGTQSLPSAKSAFDNLGFDKTAGRDKIVPGTSSFPDIYECPHCARVFIKPHYFQAHLISKHHDKTHFSKFRMGLRPTGKRTDGVADDDVPSSKRCREKIVSDLVARVEVGSSANKPNPKVVRVEPIIATSHYVNIGSSSRDLSDREPVLSRRPDVIDSQASQHLDVDLSMSDQSGGRVRSSEGSSSMLGVVPQDSQSKRVLGYSGLRDSSYERCSVNVLPQFNHSADLQASCERPNSGAGHVDPAQAAAVKVREDLTRNIRSEHDRCDEDLSRYGGRTESSDRYGNAERYENAGQLGQCPDVRVSVGDGGDHFESGIHGMTGNYAASRFDASPVIVSYNAHSRPSWCDESLSKPKSILHDPERMDKVKLDDSDSSSTDDSSQGEDDALRPIAQIHNNEQTATIQSNSCSIHDVRSAAQQRRVESPQTGDRWRGTLVPPANSANHRNPTGDPVGAAAGGRSDRTTKGSRRLHPEYDIDAQGRMVFDVPLEQGGFSRHIIFEPVQRVGPDGFTDHWRLSGTGDVNMPQSQGLRPADVPKKLSRKQRRLLAERYESGGCPVKASDGKHKKVTNKVTKKGKGKTKSGNNSVMAKGSNKGQLEERSVFKKLPKKGRARKTQIRNYK